MRPAPALLVGGDEAVAKIGGEPVRMQLRLVFEAAVGALRLHEGRL